MLLTSRGQRGHRDSEESERDIFNSFIKDRQILFSIIKGLQSYVSLEDRT